MLDNRTFLINDGPNVIDAMRYDTSWYTVRLTLTARPAATNKRNNWTCEAMLKLLFIGKKPVSTTWGETTLYYVKTEGCDGDLKATGKAYTSLVQGWKV